MTAFKVERRSEAVNELAEIWLAHPDRAKVNAAADGIDAARKLDADRQGEAIHENLRRLDWPPLRVYYELDSDTSTVRISMVLVKDLS